MNGIEGGNKKSRNIGYTIIQEAGDKENGKIDRSGRQRNSDR
ncbi:hypothetical protein [Novipirellula herctigrandis]